MVDERRIERIGKRKDFIYFYLFQCELQYNKLFNLRDFPKKCLRVFLKIGPMDNFNFYIFEILSISAFQRT